MSRARPRHPAATGPRRRLAEVQRLFAEASETLRAIGAGEVDSFLVAGRRGPRVFTLQGAEQTYRLLIESMNEGALTLTSGEVILYANRCFARMVKCPLKRVMGCSFRRFLSAPDFEAVHGLLRRAGGPSSKIQVGLLAADDSRMPAQISISPGDGGRGAGAAIGMVVTDLTETARTESLLRALTHRVVQVQEDERSRVALELHDGITQSLCAILFRSQALVDTLRAHDGPARREARRLCAMAGKAAEEVQRVAHDLRPGVLEQLGLLAALRDAARGFSDRTGIAVRVACPRSRIQLSAAGEMALYRILQEALRNVEKHAGARQVTVSLAQTGRGVETTIRDNGVGFDPDGTRRRQDGQAGLGLAGMRERAGYVGGSFELRRLRPRGMEIRICIPAGAVAAPARRR